MYTVSYKDVLYKTRNIVDILYKLKFELTFNYCESLYCTPVTYNMVHQGYINF